MVIYDKDEDGNIIVVFDSRWRFPETLGYSPKDPQYKALQELWEKVTGEKIQAKDREEDYDVQKTDER